MILLIIPEINIIDFPSLIWHSLKSGSETRDPGHRDLGPCNPGTGTLGLGTCDPGTWDPDTRDPGNGTLGT